MAKQKDPNKKKGTFSSIRLGVSKKYVFPLSRKTTVFVGSMLAAFILMYYAADTLFLNNTFLMSGKLSSNHASFEADCAKCHESYEGVKDIRCSTCHEKTNDKIGVYTFAAHYVYRSENTDRVQSAHQKVLQKEMPCSACHSEHNGRDARISEVTDAKCSTCHFRSFDNDHPQFSFARLKAADDSTLKMTHVLHTKEVLKFLKTPNIEQACLYCHAPQDDGKGFRSLDFDQHCADCHLTANIETPLLPVKEMNSPMSVGVETLEMIQRRKGPGTTWAFYTNPNEYSSAGARIRKSPVYHRDPWIMENLRLLYRLINTDSTLAELLPASGRGSGSSQREQYLEIIKTLEDYVVGLRSRPETEVQRELTQIDSLLNAIKRGVIAGASTLPDVFKGLNDYRTVSTLQRQEIDDLAQRLTKPCLQCHYVENASILGVTAIQRTLHRAEFDHRAHITQRRCLECHNVIPLDRAFAGDTTGVAVLDRSSTHNIPTIENCHSCHTKDKGANSCVTCHFMHPNKRNRGNLQLFVE